jgi:hypothetical protein
MNTILSLLHAPRIESIVPIRHSILIKLQFNTLIPARLQIADLGESLQLQRRVGEVGSRRKGDVELYDLGSGDGADVRDRQGRGQSELPIRNFWFG